MMRTYCIKHVSMGWSMIEAGPPGDESKTNLSNDADHDSRDELRVFEEEIEIDEDKEPKEYQHTRCAVVDDVPYNEGGYHGNEGTADSTEESKN